MENEPVGTTPATAKTIPLPGKKKFWLLPAVLVLALFGAWVARMLLTKVSSTDSKVVATSTPSTQSATSGGNKASAEGLVDAKDLECVPRGHDNYRTNNTLAVDPNNAAIMYVGVEYKGIFKTTDGGTTWKQSDTGVRGYPREDVATKKCVQELGRTIIDPTDSKHIIMSRVESPGTLNTLFSENAGLWESKDAGATWTQMVRPGMNASGSRAIAFDPNDVKTLYYGINNMHPSYGIDGKPASTEYFNNTGILYRSTDAGANWTELPTGAAHGFRAMDVAVDPTDSKTLWLFTFFVDEATGEFPTSLQKGPMKSTDSGTTWTSMASAFPEQYRVPVGGVLNPKDGQNAFVPTQGTTGVQKSFVTNDGGTTWTASDVYMIQVSYDTNDATGKRMVGYNPYESGGGIYESLDKGLTWKLLSAVPKEVTNSDKLGVRIEGFAFSPAAKGSVYMSGSEGNVWKSADNGKTWTSIMTLSSIGGKNKNAQGSEKSREAESNK